MPNDPLNNYRYQVDVQFSHLIDILMNVERVFGDELVKYKAHMAEASDNLPAAEKEAYLEDYASELWFVEELIPSKIRTSILISCYSTFEFELLRICKTISRNSNFPITLNDLKGKGIFLAKLFLEKVAQVTIPGKDDEWSHITAFNIIRNMIVHNNERFDGNHPKAEYILKYIRTQKDIVGDIAIDEEGFFEISYNYAYFIIHLMQGWYHVLFQDQKLIDLLTEAYSSPRSESGMSETDKAEGDDSYLTQ